MLAAANTGKIRSCSNFCLRNNQPSREMKSLSSLKLLQRFLRNNNSVQNLATVFSRYCLPGREPHWLPVSDRIRYKIYRQQHSRSYPSLKGRSEACTRFSAVYLRSAPYLVVESTTTAQQNSIYPPPLPPPPKKKKRKKNKDLEREKEKLKKRKTII